MATENDTPEVETNEESNPHVQRFAKACGYLGMSHVSAKGNGLSDEEYQEHMNEAVLQAMAMLDTGDGVKPLVLTQFVGAGIASAEKGAWLGRLDAYVECDVLIRKGSGEKAMYALGKQKPANAEQLTKAVKKKAKS